MGGIGGTISGLVAQIVQPNGSSLIDTGNILGQAGDNANNNAIIDLDLDAAPRADPQHAPIDLGILPLMPNGQSLVDADLLSGSYGSKALLAADLGPDGFGPILHGTILTDPENPIDLELLGTPLPDLLGGLGLGSLEL